MTDRNYKQILSTSKAKKTGKTVDLVSNAKSPSKAGLGLKPKKGK